MECRKILLVAEFEKETTIFYKSVIRTRFKDFALPENAIVNAYQLEPMNNFVFFSVETLFLENLFQTKMGHTEVEKAEESPEMQDFTPLSKKIKKLHKTLHKSFFLKCEKNWNQAWIIIPSKISCFYKPLLFFEKYFA